MGAMLLLKVTLLLIAALLGGRLMERSAAPSRHDFWSVAFAALLALPVLGVSLPSWYFPVPASWQTPSRSIARSTASAGAGGIVATARADQTPVATRTGDAVPPTETAPQRASTDVRTAVTVALLAVWIVGTIAASTALLVSFLRVFRLLRASDEVTDPEWTRAAADLSARFRLRTAPRLMAGDVATPMAGGLWRPTVFVPRAASAWTADLRDVVLAHEIAHVAGRDTLRHIAARLAVALYWFHPLVWIAARQASVAREEACDATVLALGTRPSTYAQILLDLADPSCARAPLAPAAALPIVERSLLEKRLMAILNADTTRVPARRWVVPTVAVVLALVTVSLGAAQPGVRAAALYSRTDDLPLGPSVIALPAASPDSPPHLSFNAVPDVRQDAADTAPQLGSSACFLDRVAPFTGTMSMSESGGQTIITRQIGVRGSDRIIRERVSDLNLCMVAEGVGDGGSNDSPATWVSLAPHVMMEVSRNGRMQHLEIDRRGGGTRTVWRVGQTERPFDAAAGRWRDRLVAVLDSAWKISALRGEESSLRGEISSIGGQESSLRGEISSLQGEVSSMRGQQSTIRGEESSLRGRISSIEGHLSSLRGKISSEQGAISSLNASGYGADSSERAQIAGNIARHNAEIARIEREIADYGESARVATVEQQIRALDADGKVAAIENQIRAYDLDGKVAAIERRIKDLDVDGRVAAIERRITALDADRRARQLENQRDEQLKQLSAAVDAIR